MAEVYMSNLREMIYFDCKNEESIATTNGITLTEYLEAVINKPRNLLILTDDYVGMDHDDHTQCSYLSYTEIAELLSKEDLEVYADFVWIEFDKAESLKTFTPEEVAELYYIQKQWKPINEYYFEKINNKCVYLSHDDAYICKMWYKNIEDFYSMLGRAVCNKISLMYDIVLEPFDSEFTKKINELNDCGVYLNLRKISTDKDNGILIPVYCMEKDDYIDSMYSKVDREITKPSYYLKYYNEWEIIKIQ